MIQTPVRRRFGLHQVEAEQKYVDALRSGEPVVRGCVPEENEAARSEVEKLLLERKCRHIHDFGQWRSVTVASDADRAREAP